MLHLIDVKKLAKYFGVATVALSACALYALQSLVAPDYPLWKIIGIASTVSSVLVISILSTPVTRACWAIASRFNDDLYPDLNGVWEGEISPSPAQPRQETEAIRFVAVVRHSVYRTEIDLHGDTFTSVTQSATARIEQGQHHLVYVYRVAPRSASRPDYNGTASLRVQVAMVDGTPSLLLAGKYFTDRETVGEMSMRRASKKVKDVLGYLTTSGIESCPPGTATDDGGTTGHQDSNNNPERDDACCCDAPPTRSPQSRLLRLGNGTEASLVDKGHRSGMTATWFNRSRSRSLRGC
jgi:hypothetical protein